MGPSTPGSSCSATAQTWAFAIGKFLTDPIWWFYLFWLPSFFSARFHLDLSHLGLPLIIVYNASTVGSIGGGWLPAPFRRLGLVNQQARGWRPCSFCACLVVPIFLVNYLNSEWAAIALLSLAAAAHQGWSANLFTTPSDMFPRSAVGSVTGIGGMAGSVGGLLLANFAPATFCNSRTVMRACSPSPPAPIWSHWLSSFLLAPGLKKVELAA